VGISIISNFMTIG